MHAEEVVRDTILKWTETKAKQFNIIRPKLTFSSAVRYILPTSSAAAEQTSDRKPVTDLGEKKPLPYPESLVSCSVTHPCILIEEIKHG